MKNVGIKVAGAICKLAIANYGRVDPKKLLSGLEYSKEASAGAPAPMTNEVSNPVSDLTETQDIPAVNSLPTTPETITELKTRLAKQLIGMEMDLMGGGRIAGKPCDCLGGKHNLALETTAEELIPMDSDPTYSKIIEWLHSHKEELKPAGIAKHPPEYYHKLSGEIREFRKHITKGLVVGAEEQAQIAETISSLE